MARMTIAVALAAVLGVSSGARAERPIYFQACDGYGSPSDGGDGMTKPARSLLGIIAPLGSAGNTRRVTPSLGADGVVACDKSLADARLADRYWLRRASLLRARAVHHLATDDRTAAARDLDAAQVALRDPADPYVQRSIGLGLTMLRAYLERLEGRPAKAAALLAPVLAERDLNRQTGMAALAILGGRNPTLGGEPVLHALSRLDPRMITLLYAEALDRRDFAGVVTLFPQLAPPEQTVDIGVSRTDRNLQRAQNAERALRVAAETRGALAYALAAQGKADAARAAIAEGAAYLRAQTPQPIAALPPGAKEGGGARLAREINAMLIQAGKVSLAEFDAWKPVVDLRLSIADEPVSAWEARFTTVTPASIGISIDLLEAARSKIKSDAALDRTIAELKSKAAAPPPASAGDLRLLFEALPHTELAKRIPAFKKASGLASVLWGDDDGFKTKVDPATGIATVTFTGTQSSASVVEELALLRAAALARAAGKTGMIVLGRRDYERTAVTTYYAATLRSDPDGYTTELDLEFVDRAAPPARYRNAAWRILPVDDVIARLGPVYLAPEASAAPARTS